MYTLVKSYNDGCESRIAARVPTMEEATERARALVFAGEPRVEIHRSEHVATMSRGTPELYMLVPEERETP